MYYNSNDQPIPVIAIGQWNARLLCDRMRALSVLALVPLWAALALAQKDPNVSNGQVKEENCCLISVC